MLPRARLGLGVKVAAGYGWLRRNDQVYAPVIQIGHAGEVTDYRQYADDDRWAQRRGLQMVEDLDRAAGDVVPDPEVETVLEQVEIRVDGVQGGLLHFWRRQATVDLQELEGYEQPLQMCIEPEGLVVEGPCHLEYHVAEHHAMVEYGHTSLRERHELPAEVDSEL